jgi:hypothetical protein
VQSENAKPDTTTAVRLRVLSLGAGVQSTTLALMAAACEIGPMPDCAIFADTGWEPSAVYSHLERLTDALPFPVHVVSRANIREEIMAATRGERAKVQRANPPFYTLSADGEKGLLLRGCTLSYKIDPIQKKMRELLRLNSPRSRIPAGTVEMWLGISTDEVSRVKPDSKPWVARRYPLLDERMSRSDCHAWLKRAGWDAPKSACIGCPYRSDEMWRALTPGEMSDAIEVDEAVRERWPNLRDKAFLHRSATPLKGVSFDRGRDLFQNECYGACGL